MAMQLQIGLDEQWTRGDPFRPTIDILCLRHWGELGLTNSSYGSFAWIPSGFGVAIGMPGELKTLDW